MKPLNYKVADKLAEAFRAYCGFVRIDQREVAEVAYLLFLRNQFTREQLLEAIDEFDKWAGRNRTPPPELDEVLGKPPAPTSGTAGQGNGAAKKRRKGKDDEPDKDKAA